MKRKPLSFEEKCEKLQELFHESKDVYTLKQLEPLAQKAKGIVSQTVKQVLQTVVADGLVESDKIGSGQYYWSFPSQALVQKRNRYAVMLKDVESLRAQKAQLAAAAKEAEKARSGDPDRDEKLARLAELRAVHATLSDEKRQFAESDPETVQAMVRESSVSLDAANRWTDNIYSLRSWMVKQYGMEGSAFDEAFRIPADFDYVPAEAPPAKKKK